MNQTAELPIVEVGAQDLPVHCPNPNMPVWCHHPRVFLDVSTTGEAMCQYCGTRYKLKEGEKIHAH